MKLCFRIVVLLLLVAGTLSQGGFDLSDALDDVAPTPAKPKEPSKAPGKPKTDGGFDLSDAFGPDEPEPAKPTKSPTGGSDPNPKPNKPAVKPPSGGGGGGTFGDSDLFDVGDSNYKPDEGHGGHRPVDPNYDNQGGADQPQAEAGSGQIAGIASAIGVALLGAASSYFAYQKKKLCFKLQGGADPESGKGHHGTHSDPQVFSNLLRTN